MTDVRTKIGASLPCREVIVDVGGAYGFLYLPESPARNPAPWVWYAPAFITGNPAQENRWLMRRWLEAGIAVGGVEVGESYGNPAGRAIFQRFHEKVTAEYGLASKAVLHPQSRGGLMLYNWAVEHPGSVAAVVGIYTVCDLRSYPGIDKAAPAYQMTCEQLTAELPRHNPVDRLAPLAAQSVPILHIHGDSDTVVPLEQNAGELVRRYRELGGQTELIVVPGKGHEAVPEFFERHELADFAIRYA
jgi:dipeptidyl aminopeptidase/acylaminoacyl peptidase